MKIIRQAFLGVLLACCLSAPLRAELMIESVRWQVARPVAGQKEAYQDVSVLPTVPPRVDGKLRLSVTLKNRGPQEADGIVLHYCLTARLVPLRRNEPGVWAVSFMTDQRRVPKVGPNQLLEVAVDPSGSLDLPFTHYLQKVFASGFWPDQLKLQVMLSPHPGAVETIKTIELILPVKK